MKGALIALKILISLLIIGFLAFVYSGWYNIAATDPHYGVVRWTFETTMEKSVRRQAVAIAVPPLEGFDPQVGLQHFSEMCVLCHGAPGVEASEIGKGQNPEPPDLAKVVDEWMPQEIFWIVRNGIKMSGMPGFGATHTDEELWAVVAFVRRLPQITAEEYRSLVEQLPRPPAPAPGTGPDRHGTAPAPGPEAANPQTPTPAGGGHRH